jgi:hypothetical protein
MRERRRIIWARIPMVTALRRALRRFILQATVPKGKTDSQNFINSR